MKEAIAVFSVIIIIGTAILILYLTHVIGKKKSSPPPSGKWTPDQLNKMKETLLKNLPAGYQNMPNSIISCIVNNIAQKYTYAQASDPNFNPQFLSLIGVCFGVKGSWESWFSSMIEAQIKAQGQGITQNCLNCIMPLLEKNFAPVDVLSSASSINQVLDQCKASCGS